MADGDVEIILCWQGFQTAAGKVLAMFGKFYYVCTECFCLIGFACMITKLYAFLIT